jgi:acetyl esterase/lipase
MARGWGADPARLFVMGHSAGAYNAAMLALDARWLEAAGSHPSRLAGWIGLAGPYDFLPIRTPEVQVVFHHPQVPADSQPIRHVRADAPPAFIGAPEQDERIDAQRNSGGLAAALRASGASVDLHRYAGVGHVTVVAALSGPLHWLAPVLDDCLAFIAGPGR